MQQKLDMLQASIRTNLAMARAMCSIKQNNLAKAYLKNVKRDREMMMTIRLEWMLDSTRTITGVIV